MPVTVIYKENFGKYWDNLQRELTVAANDIANDLTNTARATAPHKSGALEKGINGEVDISSSVIRITVGASAIGSNGYDYAPIRHNSTYQLGPGSLSKGIGKSGLTGQSFIVGSRYISLPAESGFSAYMNHYDKAFQSAARGLD